MHNGQIDIGEPDIDHFPNANQVFGAGAITWKNTLFENVNINLDPTFYEFGNEPLNVDLSFQAYNNLFRGGQWFHLEPIPATAGDWVFEDNLFDKVNITQDTTAYSTMDQPLDYDYNGYWPLSAESAAWDVTDYVDFLSRWYPFDIVPWAPNTDELQPTDDGLGDGQNDITLNSAPPYQAGPLGKYYLPDTTPLYGAGSDTPANLGLFHYTTRTDQVKEGQDTTPGKTKANIGLHYIATTGSISTTPMDADSDGIPDYVENWNGDGDYSAHVGVETDWQSPETDGVNADPYNSIYDDVDLSGNGLTGRVKAALGINPLSSSNPLTMTQIVSGQEPDVVTFEVPINYNLLNNIGELNLNLNGTRVKLQSFSSAPDGNTLLNWNTTYETPGQGYLQPQLTLTTFGDSVTTGIGALTPFYSPNVVQFFESDALFDSTGAYLDALLPAQYNGQNVSYTIQINDPSTSPPTLLKTIAGTTSSGMIQEDWDLTENDGATIFAGNTFTATFSLIFPDGTSGSNTKTHNRIVYNEKGSGWPHDGFDFAYMYEPTTSDLLDDYDEVRANPGYIWMAMLAPVDELMSPLTVDGIGSDNWYDSSFDIFDDEYWPGQVGIPGYCKSRTDITGSPGLYSSMKDGLTRNFYCGAHGNTTTMSSYTPNASTPASCYISASELAGQLQNYYSPFNGRTGGVQPTNPYRFVFLNGCTTDSQDWTQAFGIIPYWGTSWPARSKLGPQAFVGWSGKIDVWLGGAYAGNNLDYNRSINEGTAFARNLAYDFYENWMNGNSLASCIYSASHPTDGSAPFPISSYANTTFLIKGNEFLGAYQYSETFEDTANIYVIGHSGLTRYNYLPQDDNLKIYHDPNDHP